MSDDQDHPRRGGDDGTERALDELRLALEQLAARMGAGFREDLAQIRAIAASVAERDLTADVEALRVDVATLVGRDSSAELRDDVAALRTELARLASRDDVSTGLQTGLGPLQGTLDRISSRLDDDSGRAQVLARFEALEARLDALASGDSSAEVLARLDALSARLDAGPTAQQISNLPADLRAHMADALADFDGTRSQLGDGNGTLLEQLQDNLADVASGEVVGALWDELRQLRADLPDLVPVPEPVAAVREPDPQLASLTEELAVLRSELAEGLVVEPSDALSASLDALKAEVDELRGALGALDSPPEPVAAVDDGSEQRLLEQLDTLRTGIDELRSRLDEGVVFADGQLPVGPDLSGLPDRAAVDAVADEVSSLRGLVSSELDGLRTSLAELRSEPEPVDDGRDEQLLERFAALQAGIDEVRSRLDEGVSLAEQPERPELSDEPDPADLDAIADQVASLRDFLASELDTVRQTVAARLDAAAEATAATVAAASQTAAPPAPAPSDEAPGAIDPETVALLRDEIRAAGAIGDEVVDALREELKALRRRMAVKASERVLDDQQLAQIADAVAARLAEDGGKG